ncbi:MAG TPA: hypothetical protein VNH46_09720 [Gemmatimonadales bacterium]|nr:hypothetical protein [Gemmatimonadales bacterium]
MIKRFLGIDFIDLAIHVGITITLGVIAANLVGSGGGRDDIAVSVVIGGSLALLGWRRARAFRRAAPTTGELQLERLGMIEDRLADLEQAHARMAELEDRLDFAERMLVQREAPRIGTGQEAP